MKDEFKELEVYMKYFIDNLAINTKFYLITIKSNQWKACWNYPDEVAKKLHWVSCNYKHLSFEEFKQWNRKHLYE